MTSRRGVCTFLAYLKPMAIATTIIAMARTLVLEVVAEGVETPEQLAFLAREGCESYQGYGFSPPVNAEIMTLWLDEQTRNLKVGATG